jgi:hypothetical protein
MKRKTSIEGSASSSSSSSRSPVREGTAPTRVTTIEWHLRADGVLPDQYPARGRVLAYLTDENHVHDPRDEPELIDWCISVGASALLSDALSQWHRDSVHLRNAEAAQVLATGIAAALDAGAKHITAARCIPGPRSNGAGRQDLVLALVRAACTCEVLSLEDFKFLTNDDMALFLDFAAGHCSLTQLSLNRVSGTGMEAMERLVTLVLQSSILSLCLGEVDPAVLKHFLAMLHQLSEVPLSLKSLAISYCVEVGTEGHMTPQALEQSEEIELQVALLKDRHPDLEVHTERIPIVRDDRPTPGFAGTTVQITPPGTPQN